MPAFHTLRFLFTRIPVAICLLTTLPVGSACGNDTSGAKEVNGKEEPAPVNELTWQYPSTALGPSDVVVTIPKNASAGNRMPVLIALHGQGESRKAPSLGARGWPDDYGMLRAFKRLGALPLHAEDFGGMIDDKRLGMWNNTLKKRPYRGVIVVCPYLPDRFRAKRLNEDAARYGDFLVSTVLPRVFKETPALDTPASTGIDGVSLGGRAAMVVGLSNPKTFGAVGGMQAAFHLEQVEAVATLVEQARARNPGLRLRLMSSEEDRFLEVTRVLSDALKQRGLAHQLDIVKGNHSYEFNRGPGVYEMLLYYDRILRGEAFL